MSKFGVCRTCAHYGCCDDLHYCGGSCWVDAYGECAQCGRGVLAEDAEFSDDDGHVFCCEECYLDWCADNGLDPCEGA